MPGAKCSGARRTRQSANYPASQGTISGDLDADGGGIVGVTRHKLVDRGEVDRDTVDENGLLVCISATCRVPMTLTSVG